MGPEPLAAIAASRAENCAESPAVEQAWYLPDQNYPIEIGRLPNVEFQPEVPPVAAAEPLANSLDSRSKNCRECRGTKVYVGLTVTEPCRACCGTLAGNG